MRAPELESKEKEAAILTLRHIAELKKTEAYSAFLIPLLYRISHNSRENVLRHDLTPEERQSAYNIYAYVRALPDIVEREEANAKKILEGTN